MDQVREYETLYIISPDLSEEEQTTLRSKVTDAIKAVGGEIIKDEVWGKRKLAYPIKKKAEGVYILVRSKCGSDLPSAVNTFAKRTPDILRHLTTVVTEQQVKEEARQVAAAEKKAEQARIAAEEAEKRAAEKAAQEAAAAEEAASESSTEEAGSGEGGEAAPEAKADTPAADTGDSDKKEAVGE